MRILAAIGLFLLAAVVGAVTVVAIMLQNVTGAPQPDGEPTVHPVAADGTVELAAETSYELGIQPDRDAAAYPGGRKLRSPQCRLMDPTGSPVELVDEDPDPALNPFTRYGRFFSRDAGEYHVSCADVAPVSSTLVVVDDVWVSERAREAQRQQRRWATGTIGGLLSIALGAVGIRLLVRRPGAQPMV